MTQDAVVRGIEGEVRKIRVTPCSVPHVPPLEPITSMIIAPPLGLLCLLLLSKLDHKLDVLSSSSVLVVIPLSWFVIVVELSSLVVLVDSS